ncbi:helix-turn-helix domain-containing protein [Bacillus salitolerans]|uniref:Helix-turn-helix domain-containing protein n=1 Tax=Bacillus salitolerans TaxID=1437434 RepID=A0ABW4LLS8_9BACI
MNEKSENVTVTTKEAAKILGVSMPTMYKYIQDGVLTPVFDHKWKMRQTKLFKLEDVEALAKKRQPNVDGFTTTKAAEKLGVTPATVHFYLEQGLLNADKKKIRGKEVNIISEKELSSFMKSDYFMTRRKEKSKRNFILGERICLFQSFIHDTSGDIVRIMDEDTLVNQNGEVIEISVKDIENSGFYRVFPIDFEKNYITKKGHAKFRFVRPFDIKALVYQAIELFYLHAGPKNIRLNVTSNYIDIEVKTFLLPKDTTPFFEDIVSLLKGDIKEGKLIPNEQGILIDTAFENIQLYVQEELKEWVRRNAERNNTSMEEFVISVLEEFREKDGE